MPELPDILIYLDALKPRVVGQPLKRVRLVSPFLLRSVDPPLPQAEGQCVSGLRRLGKRIVLHGHVKVSGGVTIAPVGE